MEGLTEALRCLEERLGDFTAFLVGSRARGDARSLSSDVNILVIADRSTPWHSSAARTSATTAT